MTARDIASSARHGHQARVVVHEAPAIRRAAVRYPVETASDRLRSCRGLAPRHEPVRGAQQRHFVRREQLPSRGRRGLRTIRSRGRTPAGISGSSELRQQNRRTRRGKFTNQKRRSAAWCRCRCRGSGRSTGKSSIRWPASARSSPSADCHRSGVAAPTRHGCRSAARQIGLPGRAHSSALMINQTPMAQATQVGRQRHVLADRALRQHRLLPVWRAPEPGLRRMVGRVIGNFADRPRPRVSRRHALANEPDKMQSNKFLLALPFQGRDAEYLARRTGRTRRRWRRRPSAQASHLERRRHAALPSRRAEPSRAARSGKRREPLRSQA